MNIKTLIKDLRMLLTKDISVGKKRKKIYSFNLAQWLSIQRLLEHKYSMTQVNDILDLEIEQKDLVNHAWLAKTKSKLAKEVCRFVKALPLSQSIDIANKLSTIKSGVIQTLIKQSVYPSFLIVLSTILLFVFSNMIMPQMISMIEQEQTFLMTLLSITSILSYLIFLGLILFVLTILLLGFDKKQLTITKLIVNKFKTMNEFDSFEFLLVYQQLLRYETNTKNLFFYMDKITVDTRCHSILQSILESMQKGRTLQDAMKDSKLCSLSKELYLLGLKSNDLAFFIDLYIFQQQEVWNIKLKRFSTKLQLFSYGMVAAIVFMVYQIMLVPLDMLQTF